jgi:integrase
MKAALLSNDRTRILENDLTIKEAIAGYISLKEKVLSPSTIRGYKANEKHFDVLSNVRLSKLDNKTAQGFINTLSAELSPKSVKNIYALLTSAVSMYAPDMVLRVTLPQQAKRLKKAPSEADVDKIYEASTGELKKAIFLGVLGLRRGEICAVEYSDIEDNLLHIHRDIVRGPDGWELKEIPKTSESERYVLLPDNFREILGDGEGKIVDRCPGTITHNFHALAASFGYDLHLHDLRHYFVSMAHAMGIPDQYIMAMGGWKSDHVMKSVYRNSMDDLEKKYREEYAKRISKYNPPPK